MQFIYLFIFIATSQIKVDIQCVSFFPHFSNCKIYTCTSLGVQQGSPMYLIAGSCFPPQINDTSLIKSAWMRSGCHGNNYQSCLINFLNCLMIYDPMNSLISSLSLIRACIFHPTPPLLLPPQLSVLTCDRCFIKRKIRTDCQLRGCKRRFCVLALGFNLSFFLCVKSGKLDKLSYSLGLYLEISGFKC